MGRAVADAPPRPRECRARALYADDSVAGFEYETDAKRFLADLRERLEKFKLSLHPDKTRLIEFGRFAAERRERRGLAFAKDGKLLYGIETGTGAADQNGATLFSLDPATLKRKVIKELGKELRPASRFPRFSLAPDGKSIAYGVEKGREDLWMLTGYRQPGLWNQIKDVFHFTSRK